MTTVSTAPAVHKWLPRVVAVARMMMRKTTLGRGTIHSAGCGGDESLAERNDNDHDHDHNDNTGFMGEAVDALGSDNPDDFPNFVFDDDTDIVEINMVEVGIVDKKDEEDSVELWEE